LAQEVERAGISTDGPHWIDAAAAITGLMADGSAHPAAEVREQLPEFAGRVERAPGKAYASVTSILPNVLTLMAEEGRIVRGDNASHWRVSRPRWTLTETWLPSPPAPLAPEEGYAVLLQSCLRTFGPGTEADIVWWIGATKAAMRTALTDVGAVPVSLDSASEPGCSRRTPRRPGMVRRRPTSDRGRSCCRHSIRRRWGGGRDFHLPPQHVRHLFDSVGNGGTTAWLNGRVIGAWVQDAAGRVQPILLEPVSADEWRLIDAEATALSDWLHGQVITNVYKSALLKGEALP
jgi:hypothetical protein